MDFRILGPLEVVDDTGQIVKVPPRERIVLGVLLLEAERIVTVDRLVDAVWDEKPPPTARKQILICVSVLRRLLRNHDFRGEIAAQPPGYVLRLGARGIDGGGDRLDLREFEAQVARSRQEFAAVRSTDAVDSLRRALALWRGEPLAGMSSRLVESAAAALVERKLSVAEQCADLRLRLGTDHQLIEDLRLLVATHPIRETLHSRLIQALVQIGRPVEAIEVYRSARRTFVEQFGLEPGEELRRARSAVFAGRAGPALTSHGGRFEG
jgi:DNA-binding SARP family transcriptional activator